MTLFQICQQANSALSYYDRNYENFSFPLCRFIAQPLKWTREKEREEGHSEETLFKLQFLLFIESPTMYMCCSAWRYLCSGFFSFLFFLSFSCCNNCGRYYWPRCLVLSRSPNSIILGHFFWNCLTFLLFTQKGNARRVPPQANIQLTGQSITHTHIHRAETLIQYKTNRYDFCQFYAALNFLI